MEPDFPEGFEPDPVDDTPEGFEPEAPAALAAPTNPAPLTREQIVPDEKPGMLSDAMDFAGDVRDFVVQGVAPTFAPAQAFKKQYLDPVLKTAQAINKMQYDKAGGSSLRENAPGLALGVEGLAKPFIGETELTKPGSPKALKAINAVEETLSPFGSWAPGLTAAYQSGTQNLGNLPFYLVPGLGQSAILQGVTGNVLSAIAEPGADLAGAAVEGMAGGAAAGALVKGLTKAAPKVKALLSRKKPGEIPVAVVPPEEVDQLARRLMDEVPEEVPYTGEAIDGLELPPQAVKQDVTRAGPGRKPKSPPPTAYVTDIQDGVPVTKSIRVTPEGISAKTVAGNKIPKDATAIMTPEAQAVADTNPVSRLAQQEWQPGQMVTPESIVDITDWDASRGADITEATKTNGLVLAIEGGGGDGTARLHQIDSPALQREILRARGLVEVTMPDGSKVLGFEAPGGLIRPDADEFIPRASQTDFEFTPEQTQHLTLNVNEVPLKAGEKRTVRRITSNHEIDDILIERERLRADADSNMARLEADTAAAQADIALGGNGDGGRLPPPPGHLPDAPDPIPNPGAAALDPLTPIKNKWIERVEKMGKNAHKGMLNPTVRGMQDLADLSMQAHSQQVFESLRQPVYKRLSDAVPEMRQMTPAQQRQTMESVQRYVDGHISLDQLKALQPELNAKLFQQLEARKLEMRADEDRLKALGMLHPNQKLTDVIGAHADEIDYSTRMYFRSTLPNGEWAKIAARDRAGMAALRDAIKADVYTGGKYANASNSTRNKLANDHLNFLLGDPETMARLGKDTEGAYKDIISEAGGSLKARKDLRWWEKAALGDIDNPFIRIAESQSRQKQLILRGAMWEQAAADPRMLVYADALDEVLHKDWQQLPSNPNLYGKAAGMYISPDAYEALVSAPLAQKNAATTISKFVNALKYSQTVGNHSSWVRNFMSNGQNAMLSNMVDPFASPVKVGSGMQRFFKDMAAFKETGGMQVPDMARDRFQRMMELGIVGSDYATHEFQEAAKAWTRILEAEAGLADGKINVSDLMTGLAKKGADGKQKLSELYSSIDAMWKYSTAMAGLEKGGFNLDTGALNEAKAIKFIGKRYRPNMDTKALSAQVQLEVASRIHKSFPMLDRLGPAQIAMGKAAGPIFGPYVKTTTEIARNYAQLPARMLEEPGMAANMLKVAAVGGALYAANSQMRQAMGINQEEVNRAFAAAPPTVKQFKPGAFALPWRDDKGRLVTADLTPFFEPLSYLTGNPETAAPARILQNLAMMPFSGSLIEPELQDLLSRSGMIDPAYVPPTTPAWARTKEGALADLAGRILPGTIRNTYNTLERGGIGFTPKGGKVPTEPQGAAVTGLNLLLGPNRFQAIGGENDEAKTLRRAGAAANQASRELHNIKYLKEGQSTGVLTAPLDRQEAIRKAREIAEDKKKKYNETRDKLSK